MIGVLSGLLAAALVDDSNERQRRARLNELMSRLGALQPKTVSGLRARILAALSQLRTKEGRRLFVVVLMMAEPAFRERWRASGRPKWDGSGRPVGTWLPAPGFRSRYEPMVFWIARELERARRVHGQDLARRQLSRELPALYDWYRATGVDIMSVTLQQALDGSRAWHGRYVERSGYRQPVTSGVPVVVWPDGARLDRLVERRQFDQEAESMEHCIDGWWQEARDGEYAVYSYRDKDGVPHMTVAVDSYGLPVVIRDLEGPRNQDVLDDLARARTLALVDRLARDTRQEVLGSLAKVGRMTRGVSMTRAEVGMVPSIDHVVAHRRRLKDELDKLITRANRLRGAVTEGKKRERRRLWRLIDVKEDRILDFDRSQVIQAFALQIDYLEQLVGDDLIFGPRKKPGFYALASADISRVLHGHEGPDRFVGSLKAIKDDEGNLLFLVTSEYENPIGGSDKDVVSALLDAGIVTIQDQPKPDLFDVEGTWSFEAVDFVLPHDAFLAKARAKGLVQ